MVYSNLGINPSAGIGTAGNTQWTDLLGGIIKTAAPIIDKAITKPKVIETTTGPVAFDPRTGLPVTSATVGAGMGEISPLMIGGGLLLLWLLLMKK